jgi:hypothetical protein
MRQGLHAVYGLQKGVVYSALFSIRPVQSSEEATTSLPLDTVTIPQAESRGEVSKYGL